MATAAILPEAPPNVDPALLTDFDYMNPPGLEGGDIYRALGRLHDGPDMPWTPHHGGHWIATRGEDIKWIQENWRIFSSVEKSVPKGRMPPMPPITLDPPDHSRYRAVFNPYFAKRMIEERYRPKSRDIIAGMIDALRPQGRCEFVSEFSFVAPLRIFWDFVDLPYDRREDFLGWGRGMSHGNDEQRMAAHRAISTYLGDLLDQRLDQPGSDIFTGISQWRSNPRFKNREELVGMAALVFLGGQDTVAAQMGFAMLRLAERPELQQRLKDDPGIVPAAVEELLRRHGLSSTARLIVEDINHKGASLRKGDMIMVVNPLAGIDDRLYTDPFEVDFDRGPVHYNSLGNGPHKCVGQHLARLEMQVFLEEWAARMPIVRFDPDKPAPRTHAGAVIGVDHLHLAWDC